jgi:hypothetical protein
MCDTTPFPAAEQTVKGEHPQRDRRDDDWQLANEWRNPGPTSENSGEYPDVRPIDVNFI